MNKIAQAILATIIGLLLSGCGHLNWRQFPATHDGLTGFSADYESIDHHLQSARNRLAILRLNGAKLCLPASIYTITMTLRRASQSIRARVLTDAANAVILAEQQLKIAEQRLNYLTQRTPCAQQNDDNLNLDAINLLLNSNNQFATNLSELTLSYQNNLTLAAKLMRQQPQLTITLIGHADIRGSEQNNLALSQRRVANVKQYLIQNGINAEQITTAANGESEPLVNKNDPTAWLSNRRVSAQIQINTTNKITTENNHQAPANHTLRDWWQVLDFPANNSTTDTLLQTKPGLPLQY